MYADTPEELHALAKSIGLKREWCSDHTQPNSKLLHYDLNPNKRIQAIRAGAIEVNHAHKIPYQVVSGRLFPDFLKVCKQYTGIYPKLDNFSKWEKYWRIYSRGVRFAMELKQKETAL